MLEKSALSLGLGCFAHFFVLILCEMKRRRATATVLYQPGGAVPQAVPTSGS